MAYKTSTSISNLRDKELTFHLEPWGEQIPIPIGCTFQIVAEAKEQGEIEIHYDEDSIIIWGWTGSILTVYCNGQDMSS